MLFSYNCSLSILFPIPLLFFEVVVGSVNNIGGGVSFAAYNLYRFRCLLEAELGLKADFLDEVFKVLHPLEYIFI